MCVCVCMHVYVCVCSGWGRELGQVFTGIALVVACDYLTGLHEQVLLPYRCHTSLKCLVQSLHIKLSVCTGYTKADTGYICMSLDESGSYFRIYEVVI